VTPPFSDASREALLARLHLHAVLPALEELARLVPAARDLAAQWTFSLRLQLAGGPAATLVSPGDGTLTVHRHGAAPAQLVLQFFSPAQLNRTFLNQRALPPLPTAGFWRVAKVATFTRLAKELDAVLQPAPGALDDPGFLERHLRLLFKVLMGALPVVAEGDPVSGHTLSHTPDGTAQICLPAFELTAWARWARGRLTTGEGDAPGSARPDVVITFVDRATAGAALLGRLDPNAAVGLGTVDVRGLVPLADGLSLVMDRVEVFLKPPGAPAVTPAAALAASRA
jgi:hypothetical protein